MLSRLDYWRRRREAINRRRDLQHGTEDLAQLKERFGVWEVIRFVAQREGREARAAAKRVTDPTRRVVTEVRPSARPDRDVPKGGPRNIRRALLLQAELENRTVITGEDDS